MDTLHAMLRALRRERKAQPARMTPFRALIDQLGTKDRRAGARLKIYRRVKAITKRGRRT